MTTKLSMTFMNENSKSKIILLIMCFDESHMIDYTYNFEIKTCN